MASWSLDPEVDFLNHGSFGATPIEVLQAQRDLRDRMERNPVAFMQRQLEGLADEARGALGTFLGADPDDLGFVANATTGVNAVLRSLRFEPGDELLTTDHAYNACANALRFVADRWGASVVVAEVPFGPYGPRDLVESVLDRVTERTKLAMVDHVTSPTALVFPIAELIAALAERGVDTLVDGAHAAGMVDVDLEALGSAYYAGTCHKWLCAPKGAGFLWVRRDRQAGIVPTVVSHGANSPRTDRSLFRLLFDWTGTTDPTAGLVVGTAIEVMGSVHPDGWKGLMEANHSLAVEARSELTAALGVTDLPPTLGSMASVPLPAGSGPPPIDRDPLQAELREAGFEVPIAIWPRWPQRMVRVSAQAYNTIDQYRRLASTLSGLVG